MATDEVWRLQFGEDPECHFFQEMAEHGHFGGNVGGTRQGIYVCAPSGKFLGSTNSLNPDRVLHMLHRAWQNWEKLPTDQRKLPSSAEILPEHRWEDSYPTDGLVLSMFVRDVPEQCDPNQESRVKWNRDFVWFSADEARNWLPKEPRAGMIHRLPENLTHRLARFHLVDVARGQTRPLHPLQVSASRITTHVTAVDKPMVRLEIHGQTIGDVLAAWAGLGYYARARNLHACARVVSCLFLTQNLPVRPHESQVEHRGSWKSTRLHNE